MTTHRTFSMTSLSILIGLSNPLRAGSPDNMLINGTAETGDMTGWTPMNQIEVVESTSAGTDGLLQCDDLGEFSFTGLTGSTMESTMQTIDLTGLAGEIDAGERVFNFSGFMQTRQVGSSIDQGSIELTLRTPGGSITSTYTLVDPNVADGVHNWDRVELSALIPVETRSIEVKLIGERNVGASTDCFFDNLVLTVTPPQCSSADLNRDGQLDFFDVSRFLNAYNANDPEAEFTGDCDLDFFDVSAFLSAFNKGCP